MVIRLWEVEGVKVCKYTRNILFMFLQVEYRNSIRRFLVGNL